MIDDELLTADIKGITVGKNLEVDGKTQLNGGLKPIHTFTWSITQDGYQWDYTIESLYETAESTMGYTIFNGYLRIHVNGIDVKQEYAIIGEYSSYRDQVNEVNGVVFGGYPVISITEGTDLGLFSYNSTTQKATFTKYLTKATGQAKLYRHILTINATTEEGDPLTSIISYESSNNLEVDSLQDLTTLLKPTANYNYPIGTVINTDLGGIYQDYNCLEYSNNVWKFVSSHPSTTKINVSSVSDVVTTL